MARDIGVEIPAGLHTGEVERKGRSVTGVAVHVGARARALVQASEVLATSTVQMLVLGSGISFADRGNTPSRGSPAIGACSLLNPISSLRAKERPRSCSTRRL